MNKTTTPSPAPANDQHQGETQSNQALAVEKGRHQHQAAAALEHPTLTGTSLELAERCSDALAGLEKLGADAASPELGQEYTALVQSLSGSRDRNDAAARGGALKSMQAGGTAVPARAGMPNSTSAVEALQRVAAQLRRGGAKLPMTVTAEPSTPDSLMAAGLSTALCLVEVELDALVAAAPQEKAAHSALFSLPAIQYSSETAVAVPAMPAQQVVTGDAEVDAVLWLREVISTGQADLIQKARLAATKIKTPLKELEKRYAAHLARTNPGNWAAGMASIGFADLDSLAMTAIERYRRRQEARARFGDSIFDDTPAEQFCEQALAGLDAVAPWYELDAEQVDARFDALVEQRPGTLMQCVLELTFWNDLYWLRRAVDHDCLDSTIPVNARQDYVFRLLARIPPRDADEAADAFRFLASNEGMDRSHSGSIILNLIGAPEPYHAKKGDGDE